jgi:MYXO-CTERM domain-containing protein
VEGIASPIVTFIAQLDSIPLFKEIHMLSKTRTLFQASVIGCALTFGTIGMSPVVAQEATVPAASEVTEEADDSGFDDWGLLGLLGLGGLAGLLKRPTHEVRTVERVNNDPLR